MRNKIISGLILIVSSTLMVGCSTKSSESNYYQSSTHNNLVASPTAVACSPASVNLYNPGYIPNESFDVMTIIKVSQYNKFGIKQQEAQINEILKEQTRSMGGNAAILIESADKKYCYAKIVRYKDTPNNAALMTSISAASPESATKP